MPGYYIYIFKLLLTHQCLYQLLQWLATYKLNAAFACRTLNRILQCLATCQFNAVFACKTLYRILQCLATYKLSAPFACRSRSETTDWRCSSLYTNTKSIVKPFNCDESSNLQQSSNLQHFKAVMQFSCAFRGRDRFSTNHVNATFVYLLAVIYLLTYRTVVFLIYHCYSP